jgi:hypothetical protein
MVIPLTSGVRLCELYSLSRLAFQRPYGQREFWLMLIESCFSIADPVIVEWIRRGTK